MILRSYPQNQRDHRIGDRPPAPVVAGFVKLIRVNRPDVVIKSTEEIDATRDALVDLETEADDHVQTSHDAHETNFRFLVHESGVHEPLFTHLTEWRYLPVPT